MERIEKQMQFILEIDKEKQIKRKTLQSNGKDFEDDAQHAWHMAIMTLLLSEYSNEKIDVLKTISMLLIHDLVEIDAGDTYAYDDQGLKVQNERENLAANRIFNLLPETSSVNPSAFLFIKLLIIAPSCLSERRRSAEICDSTPIPSSLIL